MKQHRRYRVKDTVTGLYLSNYSYEILTTIEDAKIYSGPNRIKMYKNWSTSCPNYNILVAHGKAAEIVTKSNIKTSDSGDYRGGIPWRIHPTYIIQLKDLTLIEEYIDEVELPTAIRGVLWLARDTDGTLCLYPERPEKKEDGNWYCPLGFCSIPDDMYPEQTNDNEPKQIRYKS